MTQSDALKRLKDLKWSDLQIEVGRRAGFRCEYCGKDLMASYEDYDLWQVDHIVPTAGDEIENRALSCKLCNFVKRSTDPSKTAKSNLRSDLIDAAKEIIRERRKNKESQYLKTLEAIIELR